VGSPTICAAADESGSSLKKLFTLIALGAILLAGCRLEARVGLDVQDDGSGEAVVEVGIDDELLELIRPVGIEVEQIIEGLGVVSGGGEVDERREGDVNYYSATRTFTSVAELEEIIGSLGDIDVGEVSLQVDDEGASFAGRLEPPEIDATLGGVGLIDPGQLEGAVEFNLDLKLPGDVVSHDADEVLADGALRWSIDLDGPTEMNAESTFGDGGFPTWLIAIIAAGIVGIGGFLALGRSRDTRSGAAVAAAEPPPPPRGFDDA
jgi:hypothetical protein